MPPFDAFQILDALRHSTGQRTLAVSLASDGTDRLIARVVPYVRREGTTSIAMSFGNASPSFIAGARHARRPWRMVLRPCDDGASRTTFRPPHPSPPQRQADGQDARAAGTARPVIPKRGKMA